MDKQQDKVSFTAGPWFVGEDKNSVISHRVMASNVEVIAGVSGYKHIPFGGGGAVRKMREVKANAHLIAASPDMYEALVDAEKAFRKTLGMIDAWPDEYATIKAALSKAKEQRNG